MVMIRCAHNKVVPTEDLVPHPRNPNTHPLKQIKLLAKIIKTQGWRAPITVSTLSGFIVRGHARLEAAKLIGCSHCPVDFQDYDNNAQELADLVADNKIAELAELNIPKVHDLLSELDIGGFDLELAGFGDEEMSELLGQIGGGEAVTLDAQDEAGQTQPTCRCPKCGFEFAS